MDISEFSRLTDKQEYKRHPWETSRKNVLHRLLEQFKINFPIDRIVDIGSGDAYVIHTLLEKNLANQYFAIDTAYTPELISQLKANNKNSEVIYVQSLSEYLVKFPSEAQTLFLCMDVLEHLEDEESILGDLNQSGNHYYFFAVPAFQSLFSQHDVLLGHYRRYNLPQLKAILERYHFRIIDFGYYFATLLLLRWVDKISRRDKKASIDNWSASPAKTKLINKILKVDFLMTELLKKLGVNLKGLSCYCLCKK